MTLKDLPIGKTATVTSVGGEGALRQHFLDMGLIPKADVTMVKFAPMGDPVEVRIHGYELTLRLADAEKIEIDKIRDTITEPMRPQDARPIFHPGLGEGGKYHVQTGEPLPPGETLTFALAGNQNCGKTTLFNQLTGSNQHVGNFPGVTVDRKDGAIRGVENTLVTDLPGIYSMSPYSSEELVTRRFVLDEHPRGIINIVDATNIERNLYLTMQLMELDVPMVLALNMMDAVRKNGDSVDGATLEKKIGLPVVEISALRGEGISRLMEKTCAASKSKRSGVTVLEDCALGHLIGDVKIALEGQKVENPLFHAVKLAEEDELETKAHPDAVKTVRAFKDTFRDNVFGDDFEALVADSRYKYITKHFSSAFRKGEKAMKGGLNRSDRADKVLTHKIWGIPIFLVILFAIFHLTFSENFLYLGGLFPEGWVSLEGTAFEGVFGEGGINSPGVILANLLGLGTDSLTALAEGWLSGAKIEGEEFKSFDADCVTLNGYMGADSVNPFLKVAGERDKSVFILAKTSNPGSGELQNVAAGEGDTVYGLMADLIEKWGAGTEGKHGYTRAGAVAGATYPEELQKLRARMPHTFLLVPGYGAQGGTAEDVQYAFQENGRGAVVNSSRGIICAWQKTGKNGADYQEAARAAAIAMRDDICRFIAIQ